MAFTLSIVGQRKAGVVEVRAEGEATARDFPTQNYNPLEAIVGPGWNSQRILIDFGRTGYVDSSAIGWLISVQKALRQGGGMLVLHSVQPQVRQLLDMLKIDRLMALAENLAAARLAAQGQPA